MKILVLGYFGFISNKLDGQTVKTRSIYDLLVRKSTFDIDYFDTELLKSNRLQIMGLISKLFSCDKLIYLPAHGNLKYLFPFLYFISLFCNFQILYVVIGGWLVEYLDSKPLHRMLLKKIRAVCPETNQMKLDLETKYFFRNVTILPNFRKKASATNTSPLLDSNSKLKLVFMARIQKMKGLDYIQNLAEYIKKENKDDLIVLDFYGQIDINDREYFNGLISNYPFLQYRGILFPEYICNTLSQYDLLILPTHYYTEGLPGSVIDAYMAGIPVLVTKWKHASEFVENNITGFIIPFHNGTNNFIEIINQLLSNKSRLDSMKTAAKKKGYFYSDDYIWNTISSLL